MKRVFLLLGTVMFFVSCQNSWYTVSEKEADDDDRNQGVMYYLPRTALDVDITIDVHHFTPGPFAQYSDSYLNITEVEQQELTFWDIQDVAITESVEADPNACFWIVPNKELPFIAYSHHNILAGINIETKPIKTIQTGRSYLSSKLMPDDILFTDLNVKKNKYEVMDTTWRVIERDSVIQRIPVYRSVEKEKGWHHKAQDAADFIIKIRKRRFKLQAAIEEQQADGEGVAIMIQKLEDLEAEYLSLFVGKTETETIHYHFKVVPESFQSEQLFNLANLDIETAEVLSEEGQSAALKLKVSNLSPNRIMQTAPEKANETALFVRASVMANCEVLLNDELIYEKQTSMPQLGTTVRIPSSVLTTDSKVRLNTETGNLQSIE